MALNPVLSKSCGKMYACAFISFTYLSPTNDNTRTLTR